MTCIDITDVRDKKEYKAATVLMARGRVASFQKCSFPCGSAASSNTWFFETTGVHSLNAEAARSVELQPFLHGSSIIVQTDRHTDTQTSLLCSSRPHL